MIKIHKIATTLLIGALMLTNSSLIVNAASINKNFTSNSEWYKETGAISVSIPSSGSMSVSPTEKFINLTDNLLIRLIL